MNFTVHWTKVSREELADVWVNHWDRSGVTAAAHVVEMKLARDPENQGESRPDDRRIVFESPLVVICRVDTAKRRVVISHVRKY